jgi:hypothetical protein
VLPIWIAAIQLSRHTFCFGNDGSLMPLLIRLFHATLLIATTTPPIALLSACGDSEEICRCVPVDDGVQVVFPADWKGPGISAENITGRGPGCPSGMPAVSNSFSRGYHLWPSGNGVCHVEITDPRGNVIFAEDTNVVVAEGPCCRSTVAGSVTVPNPESDGGDIIVIPGRDAGDAQPPND